MSDTIPADNHAIGDSGHVSDHNNIADMLSLLAKVLAADGGLYDGTNATAVTQLQEMQTQASATGGYELAAFYPLGGNTARTSTALTADPYLVIANVQANAVYQSQVHLVYSGGAGGSAGMMAWDFSTPSGSTYHYNVLYLGGTGTIGVTNTRLEYHLGGDTGIYAGTLGVSSSLAWDSWGLLYTGASSGSFTFNWGCETNTGTNSHLLEGSYMKLSRLG